MHSPLEIARNYIEVGIHKVNLSIFKSTLLGFFAGMFIGFAGIASTTASSTIGIVSVAKMVGAADVYKRQAPDLRGWTIKGRSHGDCGRR